jgi:bifunctional DNA-binding transcriptional regulator/antitoxin component of YhaV-PrlF toxin-antitoxin module
MKLNIDNSGRITRPKNLRVRFGLSAGKPVEATATAEGLLLRPIARRPALIKEDGILVHTGKAPLGFDWESLTAQVDIIVSP